MLHELSRVVTGEDDSQRALVAQHHSPSRWRHHIPPRPLGVGNRFVHSSRVSDGFRRFYFDRLSTGAWVLSFLFDCFDAGGWGVVHWRYTLFAGLGATGGAVYCYGVDVLSVGDALRRMV